MRIAGGMNNLVWGEAVKHKARGCANGWGAHSFTWHKLLIDGAEYDVCQTFGRTGEWRISNAVQYADGNRWDIRAKTKKEVIEQIKYHAARAELKHQKCVEDK